jgi:hypothetical protein
VVPIGIVGSHPWAKGCGSLVVGSEQLGTGELLEQGPVEPRCLAVGLWVVSGCLQVLDAPGAQGILEDSRRRVVPALSVITSSMATPFEAKNEAADSRNAAQVGPFSSGRFWTKATFEQSSIAAWR